MKISAVVTFLALVSVSMLARAEFYSGSRLFEYLEKDLHGTAGYEAGAAHGYVVGVFDSLSGLFVCAPGGVTARQVEQVVYNYMQKHPESWEKSADTSVAAALTEVWRCKKK